MDNDDDFVRYSKGGRKKNIFDDDVSEDAARSIIQSVNIFDDDNAHATEDSFVKVHISHDHFGSDGVTFDKSSRFAKAPATEAPQVTKSSPFSSSTSLNVDQSPGTFADSSTGRETSNISTFSSSNSLQDFSEAGSSLRKQMSGAEIEKMQQEIKSLRRSLLSAKKDRWVKLPVEDTLRRILKGEECSLELYKSLCDKLALLDGAIRSHDGNAITAAVLFLHRTVSRHIFTREIVQRPVAANHYLMYLKAHYDYPEYINTLIMLGRSEEAAIFKYQLALPSTEVNIKISKMKDCVRSHFQADPTLSNDTALVEEHIDLLERQRPIDESDANLEASGRSALFRDFPRKRSLIDMSVVTTLYYCCLYHYDLGENSLASPASLRKRHQISDKQFTWTAVGARAKIHQWKDIEAILTTKGWFGSSKLKAPIGFDKVVGILHRNGAPQDILQKYLSMVDNVELRLTLARKYTCHLAVIDALLALKNRSELEEYAAKLDRYSKEGLYAFDILHTSTIKWK